MSRREGARKGAQNTDVEVEGERRDGGSSDGSNLCATQGVGVGGGG